MYLTDDILEKLNGSERGAGSDPNTGHGQPITLSDIMLRSFPEVKALTGDVLTWGEKNFLYHQAQEALKANKMAEIRILSRANPQLANAVRLGISQSSSLRSYDDLFGGRARRFVKPGAVASMFSPAGYLTELYREARNLHPASSSYHLDVRRPDLASLSLSQSNMDDELSTLSLSNELLLNNIQTQEDKDYPGVMEMLSTYRQTGMTPFHLPYEAARQSIQLQDADFAAFRRNPDVAKTMDTFSLLAIEADISPQLHEILGEEITEDNADELVRKNFGDTDIRTLSAPVTLARYYGLANDELASLLGVMTTESISAGVQYYHSDQLVRLVQGEDNVLEAILITRTAGHNYGQFGYAELIPLGGDKYTFNFTVVSNAATGTLLEVGTTGYGSKDIYVNDSYDVQLGVPITLPVTLSSARTVNIGVTRNSGYFASVDFDISAYPFSVFMLKINKLIRLYKATGISLSDIRTVIESDNSDLNITPEVLAKLFWVNYYQQHYSLDVSAALVLSGAAISQIDHNNQPSAFTRLFNTPPLNNQVFSVDGAAVKLNPADIDDTFRTGVMKRAFQVNDTGLYSLWSIAQGGATPPAFTCTLDNLSALYRIKLLADVQGLNVTELAALLSVSPYAATDIASLAGTDLAGLVRFLGLYTQWLAAQDWTVSDLYLVTTERYSTALSPDIENLVSTLKDGLANQTLSNDESMLIATAAPFIAAATQLDSAETAVAVLQWLGQIKPAGLAVIDFLTRVVGYTPDADNTPLAAFCQVLGQLALIVRQLALTPGELSLAVTQPATFQSGAPTLPQDIATVRSLARFHRWLQQCGVSATEVLSALREGILTPAQLASAMSLDELMVAQGLAQHDREAILFSSWTDIDITLQWVDMATALGITPAEVGALRGLAYISADNQSSYGDWEAVSDALQAGLSRQQTAQLKAGLDEAVSAAVSAYAVKNIAPSWVTDRDKLYGWLLLDNQVSAQVNTTRLAEAIASVQLYVNRALGGQETAVDNTVKARRFFSDWDRYNKRYSTWAGVSQLVYYPENYVDPTLRIGQTGMMDEMLQSLSQSQLTSDTVEDAFKTYMTRFEEIANLDIISGYHDSVNVSDQTKGSTWLIGQSALGDYYWRTADIGKISDGTLPANAWSEWAKITAAISAVNNLVRPVVFQSRLYLVWVEGKEVSAATDGTTTNAKSTTEYALKYAHILHDGTWSAPVSVTPAPGTLPPATVGIDDVGMYCARDVEDERLEILFYQKESSYSNIPSPLSGLRIFSDGGTEDITGNTASEMAGYIYQQLDTTTDVRLNTPYAGGETRVSISGLTRTDYQWGEGAYTIVHTCTLSDITAVVDQGNVKLNFAAKGRVVYNGNQGSRSRDQVNMMKILGEPGSIFYLPQVKEKVSNTDGVSAECVTLALDEYVTYFSTSAIFVQALLEYNMGGYIPISTTVINGQQYYSYTDKLPPGKLRLIGMSGLGPGFYYFGDFKYVNTAILPEDVSLSVTAGESVSFLSDERLKYTWDESLFSFKEKTVDVPLSLFQGNTADISFTFRASAPAPDGRSLGSETRALTLTRVTKSSLPVITLNRTATFAQYLQYGTYRIRVNTLFAKQLVARANLGLDTVLSMETQQLKEPKLGEGTYVQVRFALYDKALHGDGSYRLYLVGAKNTGGGRSKDLCASGQVSAEANTTLTVFVPYNSDKEGDEKDIVYIGVTYSDIDITSDDQTMQEYHYSASKKAFYLQPGSSSRTRGLHSGVLTDQTRPMDFSGANALYFWEMFYYVPMMVFKRLLQESRFTEATQWIKYIWSAEGYRVDGEPALYQWNVRPLEEDTSWNVNPLDNTNPDAVAQADPMHYKVATFMAMLDLLIARGDAAYRMLERDTLNEAKMWYAQALSILGDEPYLAQGTDWADPRLGDAADQTLQTLAQQAMLAVRQQTEAGELRTANSLTGLFLPQQNEKLQGYWQTLAQRLYNLRHNLSIDGQPLSLSIYATPADPAALLSAAVNTASGSSALPEAVMPLYRFPVALESGRGMVNQLIQFGSTLLSITERQDAEALSEMLQTQGTELARQSIALQKKSIDEIDADKAALAESLRGARSRLSSYTTLYDEDINTGEKQVMDLTLSASILSASVSAAFTIAGALDTMPNIYGMAFGGARYGAIAQAIGSGIEIAVTAESITAERIAQSEAYRRRRQEWAIQRDNAGSEVKQVEAQLETLAVRREAAVLQKSYLETQQAQTQAQLTFLQNKFTSKALYNWLRGKLAAVYYQFYDLTVSRCLMAQLAYQWAVGENTGFIRAGAWQGAYAGLLAGETLLLNLAQMEQAYLLKDEREKEVTRTLCLSEVYAELTETGDDGERLAFALADKVTELVTAGKGSAGSEANGLSIEDNQLQARLKLADLDIASDYPDSLGKMRRIKQISVTLPALVGPYQDVRAVLSYGGSAVLPRGCTALAVSHGMNDSGQFQLDFNDGRWLPFEGIPVGDSGALTLSFPDADSRQKTLLLSLADIILHIRYTIVS